MVYHGHVIAGRESNWVIESSIIHHRAREKASKQETIFFLCLFIGLDCIWEACYYELGAWREASDLKWSWEIPSFLLLPLSLCFD
jgi:hypothetical protein